MKSKRRKQGGFTLIELIIAIAILVILTGLLAPQFMKYVEQARRAKAIHTLDTVYSTLWVAYTEAPQSAKEGDDGTIEFGTGVGVSPSSAQPIYDSMKSSLGEAEMEKIRISLYVADDKDVLQELLILYYPTKDKELFYYMTKGTGFNTSDGLTLPANTYGEVNGKVVTEYK